MILVGFDSIFLMLLIVGLTHINTSNDKFLPLVMHNALRSVFTMSVVLNNHWLLCQYHKVCDRVKSLHYSFRPSSLDVICK
jgi:hypothetical protein